MIDYETLTTDKMILWEHEIDWDFVSSNQFRKLSLTEIRIFRKRINWILYAMDKVMLADEIIIASKYFYSQSIYRILPRFQVLSEDTIRYFKDKISWEEVIRNQDISTSFIYEMHDFWKYELTPERFLELLQDKSCKIKADDGLKLYLKLKEEE